jgi:glucose-6-phosphate dehydrogenase assembly protein OpcA
MIGLWDTTGNEVVKALSAERRNAGGVTSGLALTLVVVADERRVREAEAAATIAASAHPCRLVVVVRADGGPTDRSRLDAEIVVGGRLGPCEAAVLRMQGRLALHAESVVMPLIAPDVPVVTWWHGEPPEMIAYDPLGVVGERRVTDSAQATDPVAALLRRAEDYAPGDTDLAWCRITPWRTLVASAFDTIETRVTGATVIAPVADPTAALMRGWLAARLGVTVEAVPTTEWPRMREVRLICANGDEMSLARQDDTATLRRTGQDDRQLPLVRRPLGEELAEELRRLDADQAYAEALGALAGVTGLEDRPPTRVHIWNDPTVAESPDTATSAGSDAAATAAGARAAKKTPAKKTSAATRTTAASKATSVPIGTARLAAARTGRKATGTDGTKPTGTAGRKAAKGGGKAGR